MNIEQIAVLASAIAMIGGIGSGIGAGLIGAAALKSIARQPEMSSVITGQMFIAIALAELGLIFSFAVSMILLFANPFVG